MKTLTCKATFLGLILFVLGTVNTAHAHSFRVLYFIPLTGTEAENGRQARDGFMFATRERDGHPNEESDGHLGGLDVYVLPIDTGKGWGTGLAQIRSKVADGAIEFAAGFLPATWMEGSRPKGLPVSTLFIDANRVTLPLTTYDGVDFGQAFRESNGRDPTPWTIKGYGLARLIAQAVRDVQGDFSLRRRLFEILLKGASGG